MKFPKVPNNSLTNAINELIRLCKLKEDDLQDNTYFDKSLCEEIITSWEKENNITVPVTYKEWLFFLVIVGLMKTWQNFIRQICLLF